MNKKRYRTALAIELLKMFGAIFTLAILAMTITGMLLNLYVKDMHEMSAMFSLGSGLPYNSILQIAGFALIIALFCVLLFSEHFQTNIRFFLRVLLLLVATLVTTSIFAVIFNWFPKDSIEAWLGFVICTIICFTFSFALTVLKLKLEGKKYDKLLADYKSRNSFRA